MSKGKPRISVDFSVDTNGIMSITAKELSSGNENSIIIKNEKGRLTPDDIATMIQKAEECELNDKKIKDIHSARSSLENYLSNSQRIIDSQNFTQKVDENIKKEISNLINDIYEWLDENTDISDPDIDLTPNDFNDQYKMLEDLLLPILEKLSNPDKD